MNPAIQRLWRTVAQRLSLEREKDTGETPIPAEYVRRYANLALESHFHHCNCFDTPQGWT